MDAKKINVEIGPLIDHLNERELSMGEKLALLEATASLLKAIVNVEMLQAMTAKYLNGGS